ncbi:MAG: hypothetical protein Q9227_007607 [Pyrenula ochraceoflavens]
MSSLQRDSFPAMWQDAAKRYKEICGKDLHNLDLSSLHSVDGLEKSLKKQSEEFEEFRGRHRRTYRFMRNAMRPIESLGSIGAQGGGMACPPSALAFGAVLHLIRAAKDVSEAYDEIEDLFKDLQTSTKRLEISSREATAPELQQLLSEHLIALFEVLAYARKAMERKRLLGYARNVTLGKDTSVADAKKKLDRINRREQEMAIAHILAEGRKSHRRIQGVDEKLDDLALQMENLQTPSQEESRQNRRKEIQSILSPSDASEIIFDRNERKRLQGSGDWVRKDNNFKSWFERITPLLWITGIQGAGKSFICSNIISFLREQYPQGVQSASQVSVCYHYFKDNDTSNRSIDQALRNIAFQIYDNDPNTYAKYLGDNLKSTQDIQTIEKAWKKLFAKFFIDEERYDSTAFVVLDGLDEADDSQRKEFLDLVLDIKARAHTRFRLSILLCGQSHAISSDIRIDTPSIVVDEIKNREDIAHFVESETRKRRHLQKSSEIRNLICDTVPKKAGGMFLWADLMIRQLTSLKYPSAIKEALWNAPKGLDEMLDNTLKRFSQTLDWHEAAKLNEVLCWTLLAKRPLKLSEIDAALRCNSPSGESDLDLEGSLREDYALLFALETEDELSAFKLSPDTNLDPCFTEVSFSHVYIAEFFRRNNGHVVRSNKGQAIGYDATAAKIDMFITLLKTITKKEIDKIPDRTNGLNSYAKDYWLQHLQEIDPSEASIADKQRIGPLLVLITRDEKILEEWVGSTNWIMWSEKVVSTIRDWFEDEEVFTSLPDADKEWIRSVAPEPFKQVPALLAKKWFAKNTGWDATGCFASIFAYQQSLEGMPTPEKMLKIDNADIVLKTATRVNIESGAAWYEGVAQVLRYYLFFDKAEEYAQKALNLDSRSWTAQYIVASVHQSRKDHEMALSLYKKLIETMKKEPTFQKHVEIDATEEADMDFKETLCRSLSNAAGCLESFGRSDEAYEKYYEAWTVAPMMKYDCFDAFKKCLVHLDRQNRYHNVFELVEKLKGFKTCNNPRSFLTQNMASLQDNPWDSFFPCILHAARQTGRTRYLADLVDDVIQSLSRPKETTTLELFLAEIYCFDLDSVEDAFSIWIQLSKRHFRKADYPSRFAKTRSTQRLAEYYFTQARNAEDAASRSNYSQGLEDLGKNPSGSGEEITLHVASLILGLWYRLDGREEEYRACLKPHVKVALEILSDDDPENDDEAYGKLARLLVYAADDENAIGMFRTYCAPKMKIEDSSLLLSLAGSPGSSEAEAEDPGLEGGKAQQTEKKSGEVKAKKEDVIEKRNARSRFVCDGVCHRAMPGAIKLTEAFWTCRYCYDIEFCDDCHHLLKEDKLPMKICSPKHEWLRVQLTDQEIPYQKVFIGQSDDLMDLDEFKKGMRRTWNL